MSVDWENIEITLRNQVIASTDYPASKVIFANQNKKLPEKPFITINFLDYNSNSHDINFVNENGLNETLGLRHIPISINGFGNGSIRSLQNFMDSLWKASVIQTFNENNIGIQNRGNGVKNLTQVDDGLYVEHGQIDINIEVSLDAGINAEDLSLIDIVEIEGTIDAGIPDLIEDIVLLNSENEKNISIPDDIVSLNTEHDKYSGDPPSDIVELNVIQDKHVINLPDDITVLNINSETFGVNHPDEIVNSTLIHETSNNTGDFIGDTLPSAPTALDATNPTNDGFTANWSSVACDSYEFDLSTDGFNTFVGIYEGYSVTGEFLIISGLSPNVEYQYRLRSVNNVGISDNSNTTFVYTLPDAPIISGFTSILTTGFTVSWGQVNGLNNYEVDVSEDNFSTFVLEAQPVTGISLAVSSLTPNTNYQVRVRAVGTNNDLSENSTTESQYTTLSAPTLNNPSNVSSSGFDISWSSISGADDYYLDVSPDNFSTFLSGWNNKLVSGTSDTITGASPNTAYDVRVRAHNTHSTSGNSNVKSFYTLLSAPVATAESSLVYNGFTANCNAVSGATSYRLDVSTVSNFSSYVIGYQDLTVTGASQTVSGLSELSTYYYRWRAVNANGTSANSNTITVNTPARFQGTIVFGTDQAGGANYQTYQMDARGTNRTSITTSANSDAHQRFNTAKTKVCTGSATTWMNCDLNGGNKTTNSPGFAGPYQSIFSYDDTRIVAIHNESGGAIHSWTATDTTSGSRITLRSLTIGNYLFYLSINPSNGTILIWTEFNSSSGITKIKKGTTNTSASTALTSISDLYTTNANRRIGSLIYSPDASLIGFSMQGTAGGKYALCTINNVGGSFNQILYDGTYNYLFNCFSPDGNFILYSADTGAGGKYQFYICSLDGSNPVNISNNSYNDRYADWKA